MIRILADFHHNDLFYSLHLLFEKRLGFELYRPIGLDWFDRGYWRLAEPYGNARDTIGQYLEPASHPKDFRQDGFTYMYDSGRCFYQRGLTLSQFEDMEFDIILSSVPRQWEAFEKLKKEIKPRARHILQMGNQWVPPSNVRNLLNSTTISAHFVPNKVFYHQEFSLDDYSPVKKEPQRIISLAHFLPNLDRLRQVQIQLSDWDIKCYGAGNPDGQPFGTEGALARTMRETGFLWHFKEQEGYGFNLHFAAACGKPLICNATTNRNYTPGLLFTPETTIDLDSYSSVNDLCNTIESWADNWDYHSSKMIEQFHKVVSFEQEEIRIRKFIEDLQ